MTVEIIEKRIENITPHLERARNERRIATAKVEKLEFALEQLQLVLDAFAESDEDEEGEE